MATQVAISRSTWKLTPRWIHFWAILTVLATFSLLTLGAEVTSKGAGMADEVGFRSPLHLLQVWLGDNPRASELNYVIEHSHRIAGFLVGICVIILALSLWLGDSRTWLRWLGVAALLSVIGQGVLGIFRVDWDERQLAFVHGCTAQLVFALLVSVAVFTSSSWNRLQIQPDKKSIYRLNYFSIALIFLVYGQLILGGLIRHFDSTWALGLHILFAILVMILGILLLRDFLFSGSLSRMEWCAGILLGLLLFLQIYLGVESLISKYDLTIFNPATGKQVQFGRSWGLVNSLLRSFHYVTGSLIFGVTFFIMLYIRRRSTLLSAHRSESKTDLGKAVAQ